MFVSTLFTIDSYYDFSRPIHYFNRVNKIGNKVDIDIIDVNDKINVKIGSANAKSVLTVIDLRKIDHEPWVDQVVVLNLKPVSSSRVTFNDNNDVSIVKANQILVDRWNYLYVD